MKRRIVPRALYADVTATNAAKILGLYPKKGVIAPGSDADIAIIDPAIRKPSRARTSRVSDYSPWEGWAIQGWPVTTILRDARRRGEPAPDLRQPRRQAGGAQDLARVLRRPAC